jgi:hypothetical protein
MTIKKKALSPRRKPDGKLPERKMTVAANTTRISQVGTVFIPVGDQDRALEFYLDKLGFEKRADFPYGKGSRWIEVAPPGAINTISLVPRAKASRLAATRLIAHLRQKTSRLTTRPFAPEALTWMPRLHVRVPAGLALFQLRPPSAIPCHRSFSSATPTETAS